jgi:hypothetical protein
MYATHKSINGKNKGASIDMKNDRRALETVERICYITLPELTKDFRIFEKE